METPDTAPRSDPYTYVRCYEGMVFFSFVIDVYSRRIVGWQFATHMRTDLVLDALRMALTPAATPAASTPASPSGRSSTTTTSWARSARSATPTTLNALAESFVGPLKTELTADRVWRTRTQLELAIVEWVAWFDNDRLHESLGDILPAEFETLSSSSTVDLSPSLDFEGTN